MSLTAQERLEYIKKQAESALALRREVAGELSGKISDIAARIAAVIGGGQKILACGNGGSAADSSHFVAELVVRLTARRNRTALPAIALTADTAVMTAAANDYGYERVFARQVEALGAKGDLLFALSTSGNSVNVLRAIETAQDKGMITVGLLGGNGGDMLAALDLAIVIPSASTQRIQEEHKFIIHTLVELIESDLFG
ncbi:MAG: SIS domain-containing protein [Candidatus Zixiibacteriota bacterium]